ncbi:MAG: biotin/lipoyl-binding protein [Pirellulaceae bacterium]|nr:biotin/lipoyl-binding protein [Pirellulaceae bacterium]
MSIRDRVAGCSATATTQAEFLQQLAAEMIQSFAVAIIAVDSSHWASPMMLVKNESMAQSIDRGSIRELLSTAAVVPIACDVPLVTAAQSGDERTRALRVELVDAPSRAAILLIYSSDVQPTPTDQLHALKKLNEYTQCVRELITTLPADDLGRELTVQEAPREPNGLALQTRTSLSQFHRDLDVNATSYRIANESRRLLGCDRTTILVPRGNRYVVRAISGVAVIDSRSNSVKAVEELANRAAVMSRPLEFPSDEPLPHQIQAPLDVYLDETGVTSAIMLPLHAPERAEDDDGLEADIGSPFDGDGEIIAMMFLEYFSGPAPQGIGPATALVATEAMYSLRNSIEHENVFGLRLWSSVGRVVHSGKFPLVVGAALFSVAMFVAAAYIQVEHHVIATGSVEPTEQRRVFSSVDGVVKQIYVQDGHRVNEGDSLILLENADLESRAESLTGEIQTATRRLASIQAVRLNPGTDPSQSSRMALEERQLQSELKNLRAQQELIVQQQNELLITSPISGTVVGWQLDRRLSDRPITRGNLLLRIVDHSGPWSLRLHVPDYQAGPVIEALQAEDSLPVQFAVATDPDASFAAKLNSMATAARLDEAGQHVIDAVAQVSQDDPDQSPDASAVNQPSLASGFRPPSIGIGNPDSFDANDLRIGADVTARIACGKRSVLRSWFSDVFDFVDRNVMFYFR